MKFTLFTDHRNLTFLDKDPSPKVQRWRIAVQEYDFDIAFIEGEKNVIADGFSRLCPQELQADLEQPIRTIAMFLDSYPSEEMAIDRALLRNAREKDLKRDSYQITPEYVWEAKKYLSDQVAEVNLLRTSERISYSSKRTRDEQELAGGEINALLSVKEMKYYHIPAEYYKIISACHNSDVGHWGIWKR